jgi:hypothetical protein
MISKENSQRRFSEILEKALRILGNSFRRTMPARQRFWIWRQWIRQAESSPISRELAKGAIVL